jgi:hypothetical protein
MATASEIIADFQLEMDDMSELSSTEELSVLNRVYKKLASLKAWELFKKSFTGTTSTTEDYIALPSDFAYLVQNYNFTETSSNESHNPVVFVGTDYKPYKVVSWSDRRQYRNQDNVCFIDIVNGRLYFAKQPASAESVEFDYIYEPADLTLSDIPVIPTRFQPILFHAMCIEDFIIQMSDKAKSYKSDHEAKYKSYYEDMCYWDSRLKQN